MFSIIAAMSLNRVIGKDGKLPWHLPSDLKRFKGLTLGRPVIMGRKTYESFDEKYRPLPGRPNIVLSQSSEFRLAKGTVCRSWEEAQELVAKCEKVFVIGGESIFKLALPMANRLYLTTVEVKCEGDTFFPQFTEYGWAEVERLATFQGKGDSHPMHFSVYKRA